MVAGRPRMRRSGYGGYGVKAVNGQVDRKLIGPPPATAEPGRPLMRASLSACLALASLLPLAAGRTAEVSDVGGLVAAVANSSIDHITLAPGHYNLSTELEITRTLTIEAQVPETAVLDGQDLTRIFRIFSATVELNGLNLTRGYANTQAVLPVGGCVFISGSSVTIRQSNIYACYAGSSGGGVFVDFRTQSTLLLTDSTIRASASSIVGGGLYLGAGTAVISRSALYQNVVDNGNDACVAFYIETRI